MMKCVSSCFSCICGNKSSARVTPSESREVVQAGESPEKSQSQARVISIDDGGRTNPNFEMEDGDARDNGGDGTEKNALDVKALFIEVGKERLLRVIHIPSTENKEGSSSMGSSSKDSLNNGDSEKDRKDVKEDGEGENKKEGGDTCGDEEEDEYWFSKWARKPRFRSIFAKNPDSRPKMNSENNNNSMSTEENNKISAELEMKRAAAAAKRRAWAYNNNGNCEMTVTQQPTINTSDEEEFSSIAIVNSTKQQWSKNGSNGNGSGNEGEVGEGNSPERNKNYSPFDKTSPKSTSSSTVEVHVSVEKEDNKHGIENLAFQDDDDEEDEQESPQGSNKPARSFKTEDNESPNSHSSHNASGSTASVRSRNSSMHEDEDIITTVESVEEDEEPKQKRFSPLGPPPEGYTISVTPKKPILFFIHSVAGSSDVWHHQMEFFQQLGYEIVVPDLLGHGLSSTPLNPKYYMFESLVQDLILIFDHFTKDDNKVVLVGHGYGASLAAMLTRVRLKNVALFIAIAGGGPTPLVRRTCCQDSWLSWKCKLFHSNRIRGRFDNPELKHVLPPTIHDNVLLGQVWADGDSAFYRRITVPTLLVYGMRDKVVTLVEECEMERSIPKSFLELIENAGHQIMQEEPDKLNKMLYKFISSWS